MARNSRAKEIGKGHSGDAKKGRQGEELAKRFFLERGYISAWNPQKTSFSRRRGKGGNDVHGVFDIVALTTGGETHYAQVKNQPSMKHPTTALRDTLAKCRDLLKDCERIPVVYFFWVRGDGADIYLLEDDFHFEFLETWVEKL